MSKKNEIYGEVKITGEHIKNNKEMRAVLAKNNIVPEKLPVEEDIQKLQRNVNSEEENLAEASKRKTQRKLG